MPLPSAPGGGLPKNPGERITGPASILGSELAPAPKEDDLFDLEEEGWASVPDSEDEVPAALLSHQSATVRWEEERAEENLTATYVSVGQLTADQLINTPYEKFAHLEDKIASAVQWVQDVMTEQERTQDLVDARMDRGEKYQEMVRFLDGLVLKYISREQVIRGDDRKILVASVINEILGLGPIEPLWSDDRISEIMVNGPHRIRVEIGGKLIDVKGARFRDRDHLLSMCQQILGAIGRRVDNSHPLEDGRLADGSRINVVHHVLAPNGPYLTIRRFPDTVFSMEKLVEFGSMTEEMAEEIGNLVFAGCSTVIIGGTGSGKMLAHSTILPTPTGVTTMGEVKVGDQLLDEHGNPCNVTAKYSLKEPVAFKVVFSDGTEVIADEDHNWFTSTRAARRSVGRAKNAPARKRQVRMTEGELVVLDTLTRSVLPGEFITRGELVSTFPARKNLINNFLQQNPVAKQARTGAPGSYKYDASVLLPAFLAHARKTAKDQRHLQTPESVVTTREIFETLRTPSGHANHAVRLVSKPVAYPPQEQLIDPYLLGQWLGDGSTSSGGLTTVDAETLAAFRAAGYVVTSQSPKDHYVRGLQAQLREVGVLGNKHIPDVYKYASEEQRRALIAGLLDSDGTVSKSNGAVQFTNINKRLVDDFRFIIHSLGYQSTLTSKIPTYTHNGERKEGQLAYTVSFFTSDDVFRLTRKNELHRSVRSASGQAGERSRLRYIVDVVPVESEPMSCITVDSPNHLYLCTESFIVTHNTSFLNATSGCIPPGERIITIEDNLELRLHPSRDVTSLEARPANASGTGAVTIRDLVRNSLRMRPDRIVVGEVRDASAYDMLQAMNTGHDGSLTTVHANDADGGVERLVNLITEVGGFSPERAMSLIAGGVDIFVVIDRFPEDGSRRVVGIYEVPNRITLEEGQAALRPIPLWEFVHDETLEDGKVVGHYERTNEPSPSLVRKHRLDRRRRLTLSEIYAMSSHEGEIINIESNEVD